MNIKTFFEKFEQFAEAPDAVAKLRELILQLAVQGKLVEQNSNEKHAEETLRQVTRTVRPIAVNDEAKVPTGWVSIPLGCVIGSNTGGGTPSKQNPSYWNGSIPWASVKDIQTDKYLTATIDTITEEGLKNSSSNLIPPNCLLVVTRMGLGKLAINKIPVAINQDLRAIEPNEALALDFAYLLFKALKLVGKGVTVKGVTIEELHSTFIALPPLAEQKRIVAKVDELMALCDRLEMQQRERDTRHAALARASLARFADAPTPANLNHLFHPSYAIAPADLRKTIFTLAVQGKLVPQDVNDEPAEDLLRRVNLEREHLVKVKRIRRQELLGPIADEDVPFSLPESWQWQRLADVCFLITDGTHYTPKYQVKGIPFLSVKDVSGGKIDFSSTRFISEEEHRVLCKRCRPELGDILLTKVGTTGIAVTVDDSREFSIFVSLALLKFSLTNLDRNYMKHLINSPFVRQQSAENTQGIGNKNLVLRLINQFCVPIPPLAEQRRIVVKVDQLMALVDQLEAQLTVSRTAAIDLMEAVVAELTAQE